MGAVPTAAHGHAQATPLVRLRVGSYTLAMEAQLVQHVVPGPITLTPLPRSAAYTLGAFSWGGTAYTVIDIAAVLAPDGAPVAHRPVGQVLLVQHGDARFAMQVDDLPALVRATAEQVTEVEARPGQAAALYSRLYMPPDGGAVAPILDIDALLQLGDLRTTVRVPERTTVAGTGTAATGTSHVIVRVGGTCFALATAAVRQVIRHATRTSFTMPHAVLRGFHEFRGDTLAIIELAALLGMAPTEGAAGGDCLLVVGTDARDSLSLVIDAFLAIEPVPEAHVTPLEDGTSSVASLCRGSYLSPAHGIVLVLAPAALQRAASIVDRALFTRPSATAGDTTDAGVARAARQLYMVYEAGNGTLASPVRHLSAMISLPADFTDLRRPGEPLIGICAHLGHTVPVYDLAQLMGRDPMPTVAGQPVLIALGPSGLQGFAVSHLSYLHEAAPAPMPRLSQVQLGALPVMREMFRATRDGVTQSVTILDLAALVARMSARAAVDMHAA